MRCRLTRLANGESAEGEAQHPPRLGRSFLLVVPPLNLDPAYDGCFVITGEVVSIRAGGFATDSGVQYAVEWL